MENLTRRKFLRLVAGGTVATSIPFSGCHNVPNRDKKTEKKQPNIIFLLTDDQRWDAMGCAGNSIVQTPNMDNLASNGVHFTNAFVTSSICAASRASIFTGMYERQHGCNFNTGFLSPSLFAKSYPVLLRKAGYQTGFIGKFGVIVSDEKSAAPHRVWATSKQVPAEQFDFCYGFGGQGSFFPHGRQGKHLTQIMADQAIDFLNSCSGNKPFCLSISFKAPHAPFTPDPAYDSLYKDVTIPVPATATWEHFEKLPEFIKKGNAHADGHGYWKRRYRTPELYQDTMKKYYRLVTGVDSAIKRVREELEKLNLDDNTVIILLGDNGDLHSEHMLGGKELLYEESLRVPLIIYDPRLAKPLRGQKKQEMALNIDMAPTMLSLAGVHVPDCMQGRNLVPILHEQKISWRKDFFCEKISIIERTSGISRCHLTNRFSIIIPAPPTYAVSTETYCGRGCTIDRLSLRITGRPIPA